MISLTVLKVLWGTSLTIVAASVILTLVACIGKGLSPDLKARWRERFDKAVATVVTAFHDLKTKLCHDDPANEEVDT